MDAFEHLQCPLYDSHGFWNFVGLVSTRTLCIPPPSTSPPQTDIIVSTICQCTHFYGLLMQTLHSRSRFRMLHVNLALPIMLGVYQRKGAGHQGSGHPCFKPLSLPLPGTAFFSSCLSSQTVLPWSFPVLPLPVLIAARSPIGWQS